MSEKKVILNYKCRKCNTNNDVRVPCYALDEDNAELFEMTKLDHAAEVLAKVMYRFVNQGDMATPWDLIEDEQKQFYIQRAIEELKK